MLYYVHSHVTSPWLQHAVQQGLWFIHFPTAVFLGVQEGIYACEVQFLLDRCLMLPRPHSPGKQRWHMLACSISVSFPTDNAKSDMSFFGEHEPEWEGA